MIVTAGFAILLLFFSGLILRNPVGFGQRLASYSLNNVFYTAQIALTFILGNLLVMHAGHHDWRVFWLFCGYSLIAKSIVIACLGKNVQHKLIERLTVQYSKWLQLVSAATLLLALFLLYTCAIHQPV
ncbi:hypothetical protein [Neptunicella marina]|uniref:Uncharacterized protein n=1 Tax=Neptunicella marina TaxID=2125989 RepID=A0A8J6M0J4_9ALTE|nr:hypothetical protein [Neptunicella marina]MBC3767420.1 hypothetical protein [Neptunicella marina]